MIANCKRAAVVLVLLTIGVVVPSAARARAPEATRPITKRVAPVYPEIARKGRLEGTVKLSVVVALDGKVKSVDVIGGNPLFVVAASNAAKQWKFQPAPKESSETLVFDFRSPE